MYNSFQNQEKRVVDKVKTHFTFSNFYFPKIVPFIRLCGKYSTARQFTGDNIIQRVRLACWITQAIDTHPDYVILIAFPLQVWLMNKSQCYIYTYIACVFCY